MHLTKDNLTNLIFALQLAMEHQELQDNQVLQEAWFNLQVRLNYKLQSLNKPISVAFRNQKQQQQQSY